MNLLPFILIILALFATLSSSLLTKGRSLNLEHKAYKSYMSAERDAKNAMIKAAYDKIPTAKDPHKTKTAQPSKIVKNWRQQPGKQKKARLNIYTLWHNETPPPHLIKTFYSLMDEIYAELPIYRELKNAGKLSAFFAKWKEHENLSDVTYDDRDFTLLLYKMRKGCVCYDTEASIGYPPLEDFIHINRSGATKPMPWRLARPPLLRAYFGQIASSILDLEAENCTTQSTLSRDQLEELLQDQFDIPKDLLSDIVGHTSDPEFVGSNSLTKVRHET